LIQSAPINVVVDRRATVKTVPLNCNHCGAPLSVPETARFVTCAHCHAQLAIHYEGTTVFTEVLGEIANRTANIEAGIRGLKLQRDLERLDEDWAKQRTTMLGVSMAPSKRYDSLALGGLLFCTGISLVIYGLAREREMLVVGAIISVASVGVALFGLGSTALFEEAESEYRTQRQRLLDQIDEAIAPSARELS
jgi:LSD1 subclass zinc finger protein